MRRGGGGGEALGRRGRGLGGSRCSEHGPVEASRKSQFLSAGNPQNAKADCVDPVQACIAAMPVVG